MMESLTKLERVALDWVSHDFENVDSITANISEDVGTDVAPSAVYLTLIKLHKKQLVDAYLYDPETQDYSLITSPEDHDMATVWWLIKGIQQRHRL